MESLGLLCMPPMELLAAHLHTQLLAISSRSPSLSSKSDCFQSALTERVYKAAVLSARALNVLTLLMAYQTELCKDFAQARDQRCGIITDLCLHVQRCTV